MGQRAVAAADWLGRPFPEGSRHRDQAGQYLCSRELPYRAFLYAILGCGRSSKRPDLPMQLRLRPTPPGDMEFFSQHLGCPHPNAHEICFLCEANRTTLPWNNFAKEICVRRSRHYRARPVSNVYL
eukprot:5938123-Pyramimonas_sp.AAC.1